MRRRRVRRGRGSAVFSASCFESPTGWAAWTGLPGRRLRNVSLRDAHGDGATQQRSRRAYNRLSIVLGSSSTAVSARVGDAAHHGTGRTRTTKGAPQGRTALFHHAVPPDGFLLREGPALGPDRRSGSSANRAAVSVGQQCQSGCSVDQAVVSIGRGRQPDRSAPIRAFRVGLDWLDCAAQTSRTIS